MGPKLNALNVNQHIVKKLYMTIGCVSIKHISGRFLNKTKDLKPSLKLLVVGKRGGGGGKSMFTNYCLFVIKLV